MSTTTLKKADKSMIRFKLNEILVERGLTLTWLAEQTGIRYATLLTFRNNTNERINLNYLYIIMNTLDIEDMNEIMEKIDLI